MAAPNPILGERFSKALAMAVEIHGDQSRKGVNTPYLGHILGVTSLVIDYGGNEDQAIAALLHDGPEDQGGQELLDRIGDEFGSEVERIVRACSDTLVEDPDDKPEWQERKETYLAHLESAQEDELFVSCADKVFNLRAIVADFREEGDVLWDRFTGKRDGTLWYYRTLTKVFERRLADRLTGELRRAMDALEELLAVGHQ